MPHRFTDMHDVIKRILGCQLARRVALSGCRVIAQFFQCKWGVYPLRSLFTHRIHETDTDQVLLQLQELIAAEPEGAAYSDQQLAEILSQDGVQIARRTVVKYRQKLGIPTSRQRNAHKRT